MKTIYLESFERDIKRIKEKPAKDRLLKLIQHIKACRSVNEIDNVKKIKSEKQYYRIRMGNYRIGVKIENDAITFIRFLHRKDIYRYFP